MEGGKDSGVFNANFVVETMDKTIFSDETTRFFFKRFCHANDSIIPRYISREEYIKKTNKGIIEDSDNGKHYLFVPKDLCLWEMVDIIEAVDNIPHNQKILLNENKAIEIRELGKVFENSGIYLSSYIDQIGEGREIALLISEKFYHYGRLLQKKEKNKDKIPDISVLTPKEIQDIDIWFLGPQIYENQIRQLGESLSNNEIEKRRVKIIQAFFRTLSKKGNVVKGKNPWEEKKGFIQQVHEKVENAIKTSIETPQKELNTTIFRRGVKQILQDMKEIGWEKSMKKLIRERTGKRVAEERVKIYNKLGLDKLKNELEIMKKNNKSAVEISQRELEIARMIHQEIQRFPYKSGVEQPSVILSTQFINCVGAQILGSTFLKELGIRSVNASMPEHLATILMTSDGKKYLWDFMFPDDGKTNLIEITSEMLLDDKNWINFFDNPECSATTITFDHFNPYEDFIPGKLTLELYKNNGLQYFVLCNMAHDLYNEKRYEVVIKTVKQAIAINPDGSDAYYYLALSSKALGDLNKDPSKYEESIKYSKLAISKNPEDENYYSCLGESLFRLKKYKEATLAYKKAIEKSLYLNKDYYYSLGQCSNQLGRHQEEAKIYKELAGLLSQNGLYEDAVAAYRKNLEFNPQDTNSLYNLGLCLIQLKRYEEAQKIFRQITKIEPTNSNSYYMLGQSYLRSGKGFNEAIKAFKKVISIDADYALSYRGLGYIYYNLGNNREAIRYFETYLKFENIDHNEIEKINKLMVKIRRNYRKYGR